MPSRPTRSVLTAAAALGIAAVGVGAGAGLYAALGPATTTTVVSEGARTVDNVQPTAAPSGDGFSIKEVYDRSHRGVVDVRVAASSADFQGRQTAEGSGFVYDTDGHIITNQHVVDSDTPGEITITFWDGKKYDGRVVGMDRSTDLAVIKISAPANVLVPLPLADSEAVQVGDGVVAIGSPFGLTGTITSGIVSALDREMESPTRYTINNSIQTDAAINHGNSGGPLLDMGGRVIGVNTQIQSDSGGNDGVGFAVPSNTVREVATQLIAGKVVQHSYLGVGIAESDSPAGVLLSSVEPAGPADRAGLLEDDVITKLDGTTIVTTADLSGVMDEKKPGEELTVTYIRNGDTKTAKVKLGIRPETGGPG